jgi:hypothetical protein
MAVEIESEKREGKNIWIIEVEGMSRIWADTREQVFKVFEFKLERRQCRAMELVE